MRTNPLKGLAITHLAMLRATIEEAEMLPPWYYGLSYHDYSLRVDVFHVIPLNYFIKIGFYIQYICDFLRTRRRHIDLTIDREVTKQRDLIYRNYLEDIDSKVKAKVIDRLGMDFESAVSVEIKRRFDLFLKEKNERS